MHQDATETPPAADNNDMRRQGEVVKYPTLDSLLNQIYTGISSNDVSFTAEILSGIDDHIRKMSIVNA
ncbi:hypothetical protein VTP01DRAFT_4240 [Rhizomucor pusillus]|uniref:uncharacterized protein n=1 Tax=Rhizomucor pusillus TaxID=4840 RepID=UPI003742D64A